MRVSTAVAVSILISTCVHTQTVHAQMDPAAVLLLESNRQGVGDSSIESERYKPRPRPAARARRLPATSRVQPHSVNIDQPLVLPRDLLQPQPLIDVPPPRAAPLEPPAPRPVAASQSPTMAALDYSLRK